MIVWWKLFSEKTDPLYFAIIDQLQDGTLRDRSELTTKDVRVRFRRQLENCTLNIDDLPLFDGQLIPLPNDIDWIVEYQHATEEGTHASKKKLQDIVSVLSANGTAIRMFCGGFERQDIVSEVAGHRLCVECNWYSYPHVLWYLVLYRYFPPNDRWDKFCCCCDILTWCSGEYVRYVVIWKKNLL